MSLNLSKLQNRDVKFVFFLISKFNHLISNYIQYSFTVTYVSHKSIRHRQKISHISVAWTLII